VNEDEKNVRPHNSGSTFTDRRRKCSKRGCITRISRYNPGPRCWIHSQPEPTSAPAGRADLIDLLRELYE
jgi:hypothetical protein